MATDKRTRDVSTIAGHLMAHNLYGYKPAGKEEPPAPEILPGQIIAVYPSINSEAYYLMMDRYRKYVAKYNARVVLANADIANHNQAVKAHLKAKKDIPESHLDYAARFPKKCKGLNAWQYNEAVDSAVETYGPIIKKKPIQTIKYGTEQFFANFIHVYHTQLVARNREYMAMHNTTPTPVRPLKVNSHFITELQRCEGVASLDVCKKTVRNHRQRMEEAGVLVNSKFRGPKRAVEVEINPEIFVVFDIKILKILTAENQRFRLAKRKELPDINEITGANKEEYKEKNDALQSFGDKVSALPTAFVVQEHFLREHREQDAKFTGGAPAENVKVDAPEPTLSEKLRDLIIHPQELAENLAAHCYNAYSPIDIRQLYKEAYNGTLTAEEFRELVIQDFFKTAAKLWKASTPYAGSWKKAINIWMRKKFLLPTAIASEKQSMKKTAIVEYVAELRWRIDGARRWFARRPKFRILFPSDYFDLTRTTSREMGFEFTARSWKRHIKYLDGLSKEEVLLRQKAERRKQRNANATKFETEVRRFLNNRITLLQLCDFVRHNLPPEFYQALPDYLEKKMAAAAAA